jgi:carbon monoxide dehydrogenase subunit G
MKITKQVEINAPAHKVWKVFAHDFDRASEWMAAIPNSYGEDVGESFEGAQSAGRVCELNGDSNGMKASEAFLAYDENARTCTIDVTFVNAPALIPTFGNVVEVAVSESGPNRSTVRWIIKPKLKPFGYLLYPLIRVGMSAFTGQIIEELKYFVENDTPHPRKVAATNKLRVLQNA